MWGTKENLHEEIYKKIHEDARHNLTPQQKATHLHSVLQGWPATFSTPSLQKQRKKEIVEAHFFIKTNHTDIDGKYEHVKLVIHTAFNCYNCILHSKT
jgi:hypothetical protein